MTTLVPGTPRLPAVAVGVTVDDAATTAGGSPTQAVDVRALMWRGVIGSVFVLIAGLVVSTLPPSSPVMKSQTLELLRSTEWGRMTGLTGVMIGLGLLAAAWLGLCRHCAQHRDDVSLTWWASALWSAPLLLAPPLFSRDGWSYAAQGMLTHFELSPYVFGPGVLRGPVIEAVDPRWMFTTTPYGPVPLMYGEHLASITGNPWLLVIGHRMAALAGLLMLAWAVPRLARWTGANPALASAIVLAAPFMIANGVGGLHNDLLMVGFMAVALVVGIERHWIWGALLGGLAAGVKLPGGLICIPIALAAVPAGAALRRRVAALAGAGVVSVAVLGVCGFITHLGFGWVHALSVPGTVNTPLSMPTVIGGIVDWVADWTQLGTSPAFFLDLARTVAGVASVVFFGWAALRRPTGERAAALQTAAMLTGAAVLLSPVVHLWYFLWVTPFLATMRLPGWAQRLLLAGSVIFGVVAPLDSSLHGAYLAIVMGVVYASLIAVILLVTRKARATLSKIAHSEWLSIG